MTINSKVNVTIAHVNTHGTWLWRFLGQVGVVRSEDHRDADGERVFGVQFGREFATLTESQFSAVR